MAAAAAVSVEAEDSVVVVAPGAVAIVADIVGVDEATPLIRSKEVKSPSVRLPTLADSLGSSHRNSGPSPAA